MLHNNIIIYGNGVSYVACGDVYIPYLLQVAQELPDKGILFLSHALDSIYVQLYMYQYVYVLIKPSSPYVWVVMSHVVYMCHNPSSVVQYSETPLSLV